MPTFRRATIGDDDGVRHVSPSDELARALDAVDSDRASCRPDVANFMVRPSHSRVDGRSNKIPGPGVVHGGSRGVSGVLKDQVGRQNGRDRVALSMKATVRAQVDYRSTRVFSTRVAAQAMLGEGGPHGWTPA